MSVPRKRKSRSASEKGDIALISTHLEPALDVREIDKKLDYLDQPNFEIATGNTRSDLDVKAIAFYLPQFHPVPENDYAWGRGFTEWSNVAKAKPFYDGHHQPQLPGEMGFYDLRDPAVISRQAILAREFGIEGFCFYHYWFDGRRILEGPVDSLLANKQIELPFCLCWANETWSRRWDGSETDIIIKQEFLENSILRFIDDLIPYFNDERYIKVGGRHILLVYRPDIIDDLASVLIKWRDRARESGIELYICACGTFGFSDPTPFGFDALVEFPPHGVNVPEVNDSIDWEKRFEGKAYDYEDVVKSEILKNEPNYPLIRSCMVAWDNTSRKGINGNMFINSSPSAFEAWLTALVWRSQIVHKTGERLVFINAWNEWAEGAHLEPDLKWGRQYLQACSRALRAGDTAPASDVLISYIEEKLEIEGGLDDINAAVLARALGVLISERKRAKALMARVQDSMAAQIALRGQLRSVRFTPSSTNVTTRSVRKWTNSAYLEVPVVSAGTTLVVDNRTPTFFKGWGVPTDDVTLIITGYRLSLIGIGDKQISYSLIFANLDLRPDVAAHVGRSLHDETALCGFDGFVDFSLVAPGE